MKKKFNIFLFLIAIILSLSACTSSKATDISIKDGYEKNIEVGSFNPSDYTIIETFKDGSKEEITVTKDMIPNDSYIKTYKVGRQEIEVVYLKTSVYISLNITRKTFDVSFKESDPITYDGNPHSLEIEGYYPKTTNITYKYGSSFTNVGTYTVEATLTCDDYVTKTITSELKIVNADYDLNISFEDKTYTYDGEAKSLEIEGTLPEGVTVSYTMRGSSGNSATNAGTYQVTASFTSSNSNYNQIDPITKTLTILKADYSTDEISIGTQSCKYTGEEISWKVINTLPTWITVIYHYLDEDNEIIEDKDNIDGFKATDTGYYSFKVSFEVHNSNYNSIDDMQFEVCIYEESVGGETNEETK